MNRSLQSLSFIAAAAIATVGHGAVWTGAEDNVWLNDNNWGGAAGAAPNVAGETAVFDSNPANRDPSVSAPVTVSSITFSSGAGNYAISGSEITISSTSGSSFVNHTAGNSQSISNPLKLTTGSNSGGRHLTTANGSTLTLNGTVTGDGGNSNVVVDGAGIVNLAANVSSLNQVQQNGDATLNVNFAVTSGTYFSFTNTGRINFNSTTTRGAGVGSSSSGSGRVFITTDAVSVASVSLRGASTADSVVGADIPGTGAGTITLVAVGGTGTRNAATYRLSAATDDTLIINELRNSSGGSFDSATLTGNSRIRIEGAGVVRLAGTVANNLTVPLFEVATGRLELAKPAGTNALGSTIGRVEVAAGAELRLINANQIDNIVPLTLNGTLHSNGVAESIGALTLAGAPVIDLGAGDSDLIFASLAGFGTSLSITGWTQGIDSLTFTDASGWTQARLDAVSFAGHPTGAKLEGNELVPVPEPTSLAAIALGSILLLPRRRVR
jgi:hypothetical protein